MKEFKVLSVEVVAEFLEEAVEVSVVAPAGTIMSDVLPRLKPWALAVFKIVR